MIPALRPTPRARANQMRGLAVVFLTLLVGSAGCAVRQVPVARPAPAPAPPPPPPPKKVKLAVLPVEKLLLPKVAEALNERLSKATVGGVSETTTAPVSMDTLQLQLDCAQPTDECYGKIARHFEAGRLLWAEIEREARTKKRSKNTATTIRVLLFDVDKGTVVGRAEQSFPGNVSDQALDQLVSATVAQAGGSPPVSPP
jgi:hypothetical protein